MQEVPCPSVGECCGSSSEADWRHGLRLYQAYDRDAGLKDV